MASNLPRFLFVSLGAGLLASAACSWFREPAQTVAASVPQPSSQSPEVAPSAAPTWSALVIGPARGQLEPCGCSGGQLGGIDRLATVLAMTPPMGTPPGPRLAAGGIVALEAEIHPEWAKAQVEVLWQAYSTLGFDALGLGATELERVATPASRAEMMALLGATKLVSSNLVEVGTEAPPSGLQAAWSGAGVTMLSFLPAGLVGTWPGETADAGADAPTWAWKTLSVDAALARLSARGDWSPENPTLAFFEGSAAEAEALAARLTDDSFILLVGDEFEAADVVTGTGTQTLQIGSRLRQVLRLTGGAGLPRHQRIHQERVSEDVPADPAASFLRGLYRMMLQAYDARSAVADAQPNPGHGGYVGSAACAGCHEVAYEIWGETLHHQALETLDLDQREGVAASVDPRCIGCHVVGFGEVTGFGSSSTPAETRWTRASSVANVGCESCHGPGGDHIVTEESGDIERGGEYTCLRCHDAENDPHFVFEERWSDISHLDGE